MIISRHIMLVNKMDSFVKSGEEKIQRNAIVIIYSGINLLVLNPRLDCLSINSNIEYTVRHDNELVLVVSTDDSQTKYEATDFLKLMMTQNIKSVYLYHEDETEIELYKA